MRGGPREVEGITGGVVSEFSYEDLGEEDEEGEYDWTITETESDNLIQLLQSASTGISGLIKIEF